jgi:hypothetical protein
MRDPLQPVHPYFAGYTPDSNLPYYPDPSLPKLIADLLAFCDAYEPFLVSVGVLDHHFRDPGLRIARVSAILSPYDKLKCWLESLRERVPPEPAKSKDKYGKCVPSIESRVREAISHLEGVMPDSKFLWGPAIHDAEDVKRWNAESQHAVQTVRSCKHDLGQLLPDRDHGPSQPTQFVAIPAVLASDLTRSDVAATTHVDTDASKKPKSRGRSGVPQAEAENRVRDWLKENAKKNPDAVTRDEVAKAIGVSGGAVSKTSAWKVFRDGRKARRKPVERPIPLTKKMEAVIPSDIELPDELAALMEEQEKEMAEENRRQERRHMARRNKSATVSLDAIASGV